MKRAEQHNWQLAGSDVGIDHHVPGWYKERLRNQEFHAPGEGDVWCVDVCRWNSPSEWDQIFPFLSFDLSLREAIAYRRLIEKHEINIPHWGDIRIRLRHGATGDTIPLEALLEAD